MKNDRKINLAISIITGPKASFWLFPYIVPIVSIFYVLFVNFYRKGLWLVFLCTILSGLVVFLPYIIAKLNYGSRNNISFKRVTSSNEMERKFYFYNFYSGILCLISCLIITFLLLFSNDFPYEFIVLDCILTTLTVCHFYIFKRGLE